MIYKKEPSEFGLLKHMNYFFKAIHSKFITFSFNLYFLFLDTS